MKKKLDGVRHHYSFNPIQWFGSYPTIAPIQKAQNSQSVSAKIESTRLGTFPAVTLEYDEAKIILQVA